MAVNMAAIQEIVGLLDRIIGAQATAAQQQRLEALFQTLINQGNAILDREQRAIDLLSQIIARVSANQTQSAANSLVLAQISRQVANVPAPSSIWDVQLTASLSQPDNRAANALLYLYNTLQFINAAAWRRYSSGGVWAWKLELSQVGYVAIPGPQPVGSFDGLRADDTVLSWLQREAPGYDWSYDNYPYFGVSSGYVSSQTAVNGMYWLCLLNDADLDEVKLALGLTTAQNVPPVWPGLANVTLGTAVPISPPGQTIAGPMDGVLVNITSYPQWKGKFVFDTDTSVRNIGQITFQTDNGQDELPQTLGFEQAIYCPRAMTSASKALVRTVLGVTGTITPWVRT